jgi:anti-sigma B factor antagonist
MFSLTGHVVNDVVVIELHGRMLGAGEGIPFRDEVQRRLNSGSRSIVIDFQDLTQFAGGNYGALGYIVSAYATVVRAGGWLKLAALPKRVEELFKLTRLLTVFDVFPDASAAVASFHGGVTATRPKYTLAIVPHVDGRLRVEVLEKLDTAEVAETAHGAPLLTTIWLPANGLFSHEEIERFESLINASPPASERAFQQFFEAYPKWLYLLGEQYEAALPHARLPPIDLAASLALSSSELTMVPDFLLKRIGLDLWDVLDIKLPTTKMVVGTRSRRRFSQEVAEAVAQLREYDRRLRAPEIRRRLFKEHSVTLAEPVAMVLVGRDFDFGGSPIEKDRFKMSEGVRVYTYDDLHRLAKQRRLVTRA